MTQNLLLKRNYTKNKSIKKKSRRSKSKKLKRKSTKKSKPKRKSNNKICNEPDNVLKPRLYCKIKNSIKRKLKSKGQRWGAYTSGQLVQQYKREGGTYSGKKKKSNNLGRWYKEKWIDVCYYPKKKSCGRKKFSAKKFPYCRPSIRVNANTPKTVSELTSLQRKKLCNKKRKSPKKTIII